MANDSRTVVLVMFLCANLAYSQLALAYVGPGLGAGTLAAVLGVILAVLMLVVGVVWYPLKRLAKRLWPKKRSPKT